MKNKQLNEFQICGRNIPLTRAGIKKAEKHANREDQSSFERVKPIFRNTGQQLIYQDGKFFLRGSHKIALLERHDKLIKKTEAKARKQKGGGAPLEMNHTLIQLDANHLNQSNPVPEPDYGASTSIWKEKYNQLGHTKAWEEIFNNKLMCIKEVKYLKRDPNSCFHGGLNNYIVYQMELQKQEWMSNHINDPENILTRKLIKIIDQWARKDFLPLEKYPPESIHLIIVDLDEGAGGLKIEVYSTPVYLTNGKYKIATSKPFSDLKEKWSNPKGGYSALQDELAELFAPMGYKRGEKKLSKGNDQDLEKTREIRINLATTKRKYLWLVNSKKRVEDKFKKLVDKHNLLVAKFNELIRRSKSLQEKIKEQNELWKKNNAIITKQVSDYNKQKAQLETDLQEKIRELDSLKGY